MDLKEYMYSQYVRALTDGNAALFVGAGLSIPTGLVDWKGLLSGVASQLGLNIKEEHDLLSVGQYCVNENRGRAQINSLLLEQFTKMARPSRNHELIALLPIQSIWVTNYDTLVEDALLRRRKKFEKKVVDADFTSTVPGRLTTVFKMHGDISAPHSAVLVRDDYENYERTHTVFQNALKNDLASKTFLFLGFSFTDPNIEYILGRLRTSLGSNLRDHFWITKRITPGESKTDAKRLEYEANKQNLRINDLRRYGIQTILVEQYEEITGILDEISRRYSLNSVMISGSATSFEPLGQEKVETICRMLGERLIKNGLSVLSGTGLGIGSAAVTGAVTELYRDEQEIGNRLKLVHFPQDIEDAQRRTVYTQYRKELISHSGYVVFVCGNKKGPAGGIERAGGVWEEFEIAQELKKFPIPIGSTGSVAGEIWQAVSKDLATFFGSCDVAEPLGVLNDPNAEPKKIVDAVMEIIRITQRH